MDKENGNRKRSTKGKVVTERYKWEGQGAKREMEKGRAIGRIITEGNLGIKEKQQEKEEEENNGGKDVQ
jgi:hypothetical protein